ncbi:MAG: alpha/beta fold hydrolase [Pseudomonadota bacterium]
MSTLEGPRRAAKSGTGTSLVILLHGYGADGNDLIGLADPLADHLPDTVFVAPNAPSPCGVNPMGYQWFPIPWMDGSSEVEMGQGFAASAAKLNAYLDEVAAGEGIGPEKTVLVGFSQGTMMSLQVGPRRAASVAGIVGFSGRLLHPGSLAAEAVTKPPVLLIHGDADEVVPYASMPEAETALKGAGFSVETHTSPGTGHGIAPDGLGRALAFIQSALA